MARLSSRRASARRLLRKVIRGRPRPPTVYEDPRVFRYDEWIRTVEPRLAPPHARLPGPSISIVVPAYDTPDRYLDPLLESVLAQTYPAWELCLVDGGSPDPDRATAIRAAGARDERIRVTVAEENLGIAGNTNLGIAAASGAYIAFLDHDDTLAPFALAAVVEELQRDPAVDLLYTDEDKMDDSGVARFVPFFKPDFSPELLLGVNYLAHFVVVRRELVEAVGGLRSGYDGAQDYDFLLRILDHEPKVGHVTRIAYHWRLAAGSTARVVTAKGYADDAGRRALADHVQRNSIAAEVSEIPDQPTNYRLRYHTPGDPRVSIIVPFSDRVELLRTLVAGVLEQTSYPEIELLLVSNNSTESATWDYLASLGADERVVVLTDDRPFNYSAINNRARRDARGELLLFLNNDVEVQHEDWLGELAGVALQPGVGAVGGWLSYPDGGIQHAGVVLGLHGVAGHVFRHLRPRELTPFGYTDWPRNYLAVTGACLMVRAAVFDEVGGFDEDLVVAGNDVELCLRIHEAGYRNVFWPFARLIHHESLSVGSYENLRSDYDRSMRSYGPYLRRGDPYYNPHLELTGERAGLRMMP